MSRAVLDRGEVERLVVDQSVYVKVLPGVDGSFSVTSIRLNRPGKPVPRFQAGQCRILMVGRTGVGKSSTINSVLGIDIATVGHFEPTTAELYSYHGHIAGSPVLAMDTPGFCDARDRTNDERYVAVIKRLVSEIDILLFVTRLDDPRVESSELDTLTTITQAFGTDIWDHAVVVLTRSDVYRNRREFAAQMEGRERVLRQHLREHTDRADDIPFVPVSNRQKRTPDRKRWLPRLWVAMLQRISDHGFESFLLATIDRVESEDVDDAPEDDSDAEASPEPRAQTRPHSASKQDKSAGTTPRSASKSSGSGPRHLPAVVRRPAAREVLSPEIVPAGGQLRAGEARPAPELRLTRKESYHDGIKVTEATFNVDRGVSTIYATNSDIRVIQHVIQERSPRIAQAIKTAAVWVGKRLRKLFAW